VTSKRKRLTIALLAFAIAIIVVLVAGAAGVRYYLFGALGEPKLWDGAEWHDDWFAVEKIDDGTFVIGEPRYWQVNLNYLIVGESRAILFDTGPGARDIAPVVRSLTSLPVTVVLSHLHFDHVGNCESFERFAVADLPILRERVKDGVLRSTFRQCLGPFRPKFRVTEWVKPDETMDLGGRRLKVIHVPGHTPESIALFDLDRKLIFTGDFIYPGELIAFVPGSDLREYLQTTRRLLEMTSGDETLLGAHMSSRLGRDALVELEEGLEAILDGSAQFQSVFPFRSYAVSSRFSVLTSRSPDIAPPAER